MHLLLSSDNRAGLTAVSLGRSDDGSIRFSTTPVVGHHVVALMTFFEGQSRNNFMHNRN